MSSRRARGDRLTFLLFHVDEWLSSPTVGALSLAGQGAYLRLLLRQWQLRGDGLPADPEEVRQWAGWHGGRGWDDQWAKLAKQFPLGEDGTRRNVKLHAQYLAVLDDADRKRVLARIAGHASAEARRKLAEQASATRAPAPAETGNQFPPNFAIDSLTSEGIDRTQVVVNQQSEATDRQQSVNQSILVPLLRAEEVPSSSTDRAEKARPSDELRILSQFTDLGHRKVVAGYLDSRPAGRRGALLATLEAMHTGLGGKRGKAATWYQIGAGVCDALASVEGDITANQLRGFVDRAPAEPMQAEEDAPALTDAPGTIRDAAGVVVWHSGMPAHLRPVA